MGVDQGQDDLGTQLQRRLERQRSLVEALAQLLALEVLHDQERPQGGVEAEVVDDDDVRVV